MTKDKVNFRYSMKYAQGAAAVEDNIGITELRSPTGRCSDMNEERNSRLTGLMKWSLDDYVVKEMWPSEAFASPSTKDLQNVRGPAAFALKIVAEGIPDETIAKLIERKCPPRTSVRFTTPLDFCSSQERIALVCSHTHASKRNFQCQQVAHVSEGVVCIGGAVDISLHLHDISSLPLCILPDVSYSVVFRGLRGSLADILPRLEALRSNGFINYTHLARHGVGLFRAFESGRQLLHREYAEFLRGYVLSLTERSPAVHKELPPFLEAIVDPKLKCSDWAGVRKGLEYALKRDEPLINLPQTGLYYPHHTLLRDLVERAADLLPKEHDSAQVIRNAVPRLIIQEKLRSVADVHFNALASLRWKMYGDRVVPGDLVLRRGDSGHATEPLDVFDAPADHINGGMTSVSHTEWLSAAGEKHLDGLLERVHLVSSEKEAQSFTTDDIVLPVLGRFAERLILPNTKMKDAFQHIAQELQVEGLPRLRAAPPATYRWLIERPKKLAYCIFDESRGWCWESDNNEPIRSQLYEDREGVLRQPSPLMAVTGKNMVARRGIRGTEQRHHYLKPARRGGMTCVVRMTLPRGTAITSALREVVQVATLDTGAIFRLLK
ncbi:uncharacterized protein TEOVI_000008900 [Trypanosoma equiperdum]|uniref:TRUD domain-containing protein n=2 Tax=Trypanozoon TaxID=39700 RepID=Q38DA8_TRYB2|nr:hypothetical protein, conserved [Trypanosoma brucei brucei TREU927]EAN77212.1 hypothetical protein, conserved [Trypanosoma brucei brucei TREU927]SCU64357.1 hypothetical protein, conserved [Trypanosoma equiperdum]